MTKSGLRARVRQRLGRAAARVLGPAQDDACWKPGEGAVLHPGAQLENISGVPDRVQVGAHSQIRGRLLVFPHTGRIRIGDWTYIGVRTEVWSQHSVDIGNRVLIAHGVNITDTASHPLEPDARHKHFRAIVERGHPAVPPSELGISTGPIVIEDDVWISFGVTILRGVRIGARSIIAAGSMVLRDVPPDSIYRNEVSPVIVPRPAP